MTVTRLPSGKWRARVKVGGNVVADKAFDRRADAVAWHAMQKRAILLGEFVDPKAGKETLGHVRERWLRERQDIVSSTTHATDLSLLRINIPATVANRPIASIRDTDIEALLADMVRAGLSKNSVSRFRSSLSALFAWAVRQRLVAKNPVLAVRVPKGTGQSAVREVHPFTLQELREVVEELREHSPEQAEVAHALGLTGMRWSELVALRVRDVQMLPRPALRISRAAPDGHAVRNTTKSGKPRTVPLVAELVPVIADLIAGKGPDDLVFTSQDGHRLNGSNWRRAVQWEQHSRGRRVHDLRHTAATLWLTNRIDPKTVQTWLGHASMTLTVDLYSHWLGSDADAAAILRLNAILGDTGGTRDPNLRAAEGPGEGGLSI